MSRFRIAVALGLLLTGTPILAAEGERAALVEQVRAAELAFAKSVAEDAPERFASFLDPDTVFVSGRTVTNGKAAVIEGWKVYFGADRPQFEWAPDVVELSGDGTLGLSRGRWTMRGKDPEGKPFEAAGLFNSVWRRQPDGTWKVIFDAGCGPCPKCG